MSGSRDTGETIVPEGYLTPEQTGFPATFGGTPVPRQAFRDLFDLESEVKAAVAAMQVDEVAVFEYPGSGSLQDLAQKAATPVVHAAIPDRGYRSDGSSSDPITIGPASPALTWAAISAAALAAVFITGLFVFGSTPDDPARAVPTSAFVVER